MVYENSIASLGKIVCLIDEDGQVHDYFLTSDGFQANDKVSCQAEQIISTMWEIYMISPGQISEYKSGLTYPICQQSGSNVSPTIKDLSGLYLMFATDSEGCLRLFNRGVLSDKLIEDVQRVEISTENILILDNLGKLHTYSWLNRQISHLKTLNSDYINQFELSSFDMIVRCGLKVSVFSVKGEWIRDIDEVYPCSRLQKAGQYFYCYGEKANLKKFQLNGDKLTVEEIADSQNVNFVFTVDNRIFMIDDYGQVRKLQQGRLVEETTFPIAMIKRNVYNLRKNARSSSSLRSSSSFG